MTQAFEQFQRRADSAVAGLTREVGLAEGQVKALVKTRTNAWTSTVADNVVPATGPDVNSLWTGARVLYESSKGVTVFTASVTLTRLNCAARAYITVFEQVSGARVVDQSAMFLDNRPEAQDGTTTRLNVSGTYAFRLPPGRYDAVLYVYTTNPAAIAADADTTMTVHSATLTVKDI